MIDPTGREVVYDPGESYEDDNECFECGGEGFIVDDCFDDTCCCLDPESEHGIIPCPNCTKEQPHE